MVKELARLREWCGAVALTLALHLAAMMVPVPVLPPGQKDLPADEFYPAGQGGEGRTVPVPVDMREENGGQAGARRATIPFRPHDRRAGSDLETGWAVPPLAPLVLPAVQGSGFHSLARRTAVAKLMPPAFGADTIPKKPDKDMFRLVEENADEYLLGDVFQDAVPATASRDLAGREAAFLAELRRDIGDGRLDMPFSSFIVAAEYYQLSRALREQGLQPAFTLDEALARYGERKARVAAGLPAEIDGFAAAMILQRYGENKFYPGNGSGMLLDSLFHNLNDCEAGTKEVLAYLDDLYPRLTLGSNRGLLRTIGGDFIGHMQVYLGPDAATRRIVESERGVVIETTRIGRDSILPYLAGEVFPLEDFVARYYPEIVAGTPLEGLLSGTPGEAPDEARRIVGTSDHPLKMSYGGSGALLTAQYYDLANIRTRKIENEFLRSSIPGCDPRIDPTRIDRTNLFSNYVAIDPKLRKNLIDHYLADLDYWDNQVMPQWRLPAIIATYGDLAGSLLEQGGKGEREGYLQVDGENTVAVASLASHRRFLLALRERSSPDARLGTGRRDCRERTVLDERLLEYLFAAPAGPGLYFLPEPAAGLSWPQVLADTVGDCLAIPAQGPARSQLAALEEAALAAGTSLRRELYRRTIARGLLAEPEHDPLANNLAAVAAILTGSGAGPDPAAALACRQSAASSPEEPSVRETAEELGRTGINSGLVWDLVDFQGEEKTRLLLLTYARREDLRLSVLRAGELVDTAVGILADQESGAGAAERFLAELVREAFAPRLALAARLALARLTGEPPAAVSAIAADYLRGVKTYRTEDLLALLRYGLGREDAAAFVRGRIEAALASLPSHAARGGAEADPRLFLDLVELARTVDALADLSARRRMAEGLAGSLLGDFRLPPARSGGDFGVLFSKLSVFAILRETCGGQELPVETKPLLGQAIRFAAGEPVGKLMVGLLDRIFTPERYGDALFGLIEEQFAELSRLPRLSRTAGNAGDIRERLKTLLGDANVLARLVLQADGPILAKAEGLMPEGSDRGARFIAASYLERLHRRVAVLVREGGGGDAYDGGLYPDDRVREAMAMLALVQEGRHGERVKFRKIKDIRDIKDPSKIQVIEAERKITRQDMSLLTLALNEFNSPREIRRAWDGTIAVTERHLALAPRDEALAAYLFAPHFPYLQRDDLGFFFSPETVEDLHNADQWGGRNDILLSSYLHFRNLPERLPDWLLRTALTRSEFERRIIEKFERESFLPMILECAADHETLPEGLFRAQWTIRKPFGEDIFPGTLLLLRMGYLAITPDGQLVFTAKYTG